MDHIDWSQEPDRDLLYRAYSLLESNPEQALLELKALADRGSVASMLCIADSYRLGKTSTIDLVQAEEWYRRAMNAGSVLGSYSLGRIYYGMENYLKAAEAFRVGEGKDYSPSLHALGQMYLNGYGFEKDVGKARDLLERASELGHAFAKCNLAKLLLRGGYGPLQFFRGLGLFLVGLKDVVTITWKDQNDDRVH